MRRDAQFYMIDAFFAAAILFVGIGMLVSEYVNVPEQEQARTTLEDVADLLFNRPLYDIDHPWVLNNTALLESDLTPMQQVQVWLYNTTCSECADNAAHMIGNLTDDTVPDQYGAAVLLYPSDVETTLYNRSVLREPDLLFSRKAIMTTLWNETDLVDLAEVQIWR